METGTASSRVPAPAKPRKLSLKDSKTREWQQPTFVLQKKLIGEKNKQTLICIYIGLSDHKI